MTLVNSIVPVAPPNSIIDATSLLGAPSPPASERGAAAPASNGDAPAEPGIGEFQIWNEHTHEDLQRDLLRLRQVAKDKYAIDGSKSVDRYYTDDLHAIMEQARKELERIERLLQ